MYQLEVDKMSCQHCVRAVTAAVKSVDETASVSVDLASKQVSIASASPLAPLTAAINEAGYPVLSAA